MYHIHFPFHLHNILFHSLHVHIHLLSLHTYLYHSYDREEFLENIKLKYFYDFYIKPYRKQTHDKQHNKPHTTMNHTTMNHTTMNHKNEWMPERVFTENQKEKRFKSCSCKDIIVNDVEKWFMEDLAFKSLYTSCKERPDLPENKFTKDSTITNNNFLRIVSKIIDTTNRDSSDGYFPSERDWYHEPCENQIDIYSVSGRRDGEFYLYTASCHPHTSYLVKTAMVTFLFNTITSNEMIRYTLDTFRNCTKFESILGKKLVEFKEGKIYNSKWMGTNYYYKKLYAKPIYFHDMEIPTEILDFRKYTCFNDMICGHPKASHGWCNESLQELRDLKLVSF